MDGVTVCLERMPTDSEVFTTTGLEESPAVVAMDGNTAAFGGISTFPGVITIAGSGRILGATLAGC